MRQGLLVTGENHCVGCFTGSPVCGQPFRYRRDRVRFYASIPLETRTGFVPGTLCVFSEDVQELSPEQIGVLEVLATQVVELLELQHRTAQLDRAYGELKESNARLAGFAGRVSHDMRTPLTTMLGYLEMLQEDPRIQALPDAAADLDKVATSGARMLSMLEDVLNYSRVGGGIRRAMSRSGPRSTKPVGTSAWTTRS